MITDYKITEIFCATDEFSKKFDEEIENMPDIPSIREYVAMGILSKTDLTDMDIDIDPDIDFDCDGDD